MGNSLFFAFHYLRHHRWTTLVLITSVTLILYLPTTLQVIVNDAEEHFRARAATTPWVIGPEGSSLDLVLSSLYFDKSPETTLDYAEFEFIEQQEDVKAVPLHTGFSVESHVVVGTTHDYLDARSLTVASGREWRILGECVVGASAAETLDIEIGSKIPLSQSSLFMLGDAPLRLHVVGILAAQETPDDDALYVDLETTWVALGLGHGHAAGAKHGSPEAAIFTDITEENVDSFHFHGYQSEYPISSVIAFPSGQRAETLLRSRYLKEEIAAQMVKPSDEMDRLLENVLMIRSYVIAVIIVVGFATFATMALVMALSIRLRREELSTMTKIGCSRLTIVQILGTQILLILVSSITLAACLTLLTANLGRDLVHSLVT